MKMHPSVPLAALLCLVCALQAQDNPPSVAPDSLPGSEMQKWIAANDVQWQSAFKRDVADVRDAELGKLKQQYLTALEAAVTKASSAGNLDGALALRNEQKRFDETYMIPEQDEGDEAALVKQLRASVRTQLVKLEKDIAVRAKALHAKYDQFLAHAQTQLTQRKRLDDALLVKNKREEVAAVWVTPAIAAGAQKGNSRATALTPNVQQPGSPGHAPVGTGPGPEFTAKIPANSADAFQLGSVRKGTRISLQYVAGTWKAWGLRASYSPDQESAMERGDVSRLAIALPSKGGKGGDLLAVVPANTTQSPFVFEAKSDYPNLVLRINDRENSFAENPGSVKYRVTILPPAK